MFCWTARLTGGPRLSYPVVSVQHKVYTFGGRCDDNTAQIGVYVFNTVSFCWRKLPHVTPGRERHLQVLFCLNYHSAVVVEDVIYLWGGIQAYSDGYSNVLYAFDLDTHRWFKPRVSGSVPEGRVDHSACVLGKVMFIHGGEAQLTGCTNDTYKLDTSIMVWSVINARGTQPPASQGHSSTFIGTKMFVFGGKAGWRGQYHNTIRVFDTQTNHWLNTPEPEPEPEPSAQLLPEGRWFHSAFAYNGELYIFGGESSKFHNNLWKFNPEIFAWKTVQPKRKGPHPMRRVCCIVGDCIFLSGAYDDVLHVLDLSPSLKTLCKLAVIQYGLDKSELPHNIRWELAAITTK